MTTYVPRQKIRSNFQGIHTQTCKTLPVQLIGTPSGGANTVLLFRFRLSDITDYAQWTSVFDQYRFKRITAIIQGSNQTSNLATPMVQPFVTVIDYDDATTTIASLGAALNYGSSYIHHPTCNDRRSFVPHTSGALYSGGAATGASNVKNQWIDAATTDVDHFGFKVFIAPSTTTNVYTWMLYFEYVMEYKNNR